MTELYHMSGRIFVTYIYDESTVPVPPGRLRLPGVMSFHFDFHPLENVKFQQK
jgi:hypothetical protein